MANYAYLCATNLATTYPSFVEEHYDSDVQTIACDVYCIPLVWMALFRPQDLLQKEFSVDGVDVSTEAPCVERAVALRQLREALPFMNEVFSEEGPLDAYFDLFEQAVRAVDAKFLTVQLDEIACLYPSEQEFYDKLRQALAHIAQQAVDGAKPLFAEIANIRLDRPFPSARLILDDLAGEAGDFWNHCRILGAGADNAGMGRATPWERVI